MPEGLPRIIDPHLLARKGARLQGRVPFGGMGRLREALASADGAAEVELDFGIDAQGLRTVTGRVAAEVTLRCQRCLGPVAYRVACDVALALVSSETEERRLPACYEPLHVDPERGTLATGELVEDELLLALPLVAMHEDDAACGGGAGSTTGGEAERERPFDVLKNWKGRQDGE